MKKIFQDLLSNIPEYKEFLTLEEMDASSKKLAQEFPDCVEIFEMGKTRDNRPLQCLKIGSGSKNALMFGCPHPNEPIGTMLLEYLTKNLAENKELRDELDYTWYVVKAWDADGYKLNENWIKGPYTIYNYSRNFFRPAGHKQVDWTFPIDYKELHFHTPIPETSAMMKLIDDIKPEFIYSLHNAGFGGTYWYITHPVDEIYSDMHNASTRLDMPMNLGEPEAPYCVALAPAIYKNLGIQEDYDYMEKYGQTNIGEKIKVGTCSADYAKSKYNSFTLLTELPYFYDERIMDLSPSDMSRRDAALEKLRWSQEQDKIIVEILKKTMSLMESENPFKLALEAFTEGHSAEATRKMIMENPDFSKPATVAEKFDNLIMGKFYKALSFGMLIRANEYELERMAKSGEKNAEKKSALEQARDLAIPLHKDLADMLEKELNYQVVPIKKLVSIQLESGLLVAEYLKNHRK